MIKLLSIFNSRLIRLLLCSALVFAGAEACTRLIFFGPDAWAHPQRYSPAQLLEGPYVNIDPKPGVPYLLKPNVAGYFKGKPLSSNAHGLRDRAFEMEHSEGRVRILFLGGSIEMGSGVSDEEVYIRKFSRWLEKDYPGRFEVLNFGLAGYQMESSLSLYKNMAAKFKPDVVVFPATFTRLGGKDLAAFEKIIFSARNCRLPLLDRLDVKKLASRHSFFYGAARRLFSDGPGGLLARWPERTAKETDRRKDMSFSNQPERLEVLRKFIEDLHRDKIVVVGVNYKCPTDSSALTYEVLKRDVESWFRRVPGAYYVDLFSELDPLIGPNDRIYPGDNHPNARAHSIYAQILSKELIPILRKEFSHGGRAS